MAIFGRFNEKAQRVIGAAQQAAVELSQPYVGSEHFLIGLLREARADAPAAYLKRRLTHELHLVLYLPRHGGF